MIPVHALAAVIPAYQAERCVGDVVRRATRVVDHVLVIDDGSTDDTSRVAGACGARVIRHEQNRGKGRALQTGFEDLFSRGFEHVVTLDADGQHLPEEIGALIPPLKAGADMVVGSRTHLFPKMHVVRRTSNRCSSRLISWVAGTDLGDIQSGFRIYTRRLLDATGFPEPRFEAESAVVVRAVRMGFQIAAVPVRLGFPDGRATSHYRPIVDSLRIAAAVSRARFEKTRWQTKRS